MRLKDVISLKHGSHSQRYLAIFLWIFFGFLHVSLISQWMTVSRRDEMFTAYIDQVMHKAASEQLPATEVRALLLIRAEDLSLPVHGDEIDISRNGQMLKAGVHYRTDITLPFVNQSVHRMRFDHDLTLKPTR